MLTAQAIATSCGCQATSRGMTTGPTGTIRCDRAGGRCRVSVESPDDLDGWKEDFEHLRRPCGIDEVLDIGKRSGEHVAPAVDPEHVGYEVLANLDER
jgi:hypothetical protein